MKVFNFFLEKSYLRLPYEVNRIKFLSQALDRTRWHMAGFQQRSYGALHILSLEENPT